MARSTMPQNSDRDTCGLLQTGHRKSGSGGNFPICDLRWASALALKPCLQDQTLTKLASNEGLTPIGEILYEAKNLTELEIQSGFRFGFPEDISSLKCYLSFRRI